MFAGALHDIWSLIWIWIKVGVVHFWWAFLIVIALIVLVWIFKPAPPPSDYERGVPPSGDGYHTW